MKKKVLCTALVLLLLLSLSACGGDKASTSEPSATPAEAEKPVAPEENTIDTEEPEESAAENNGRMEQSGTLGNFDVEIKDAVLSEDYEGNQAIVITYSWTNNSEETTSVMSSMMEQAFQDGVELDVAIMDNPDIYDADGQLKDVRPGTTIDAQCAFVLTSNTSVVEFEISEFLSFTHELVVMDFDPATL